MSDAETFTAYRCLVCRGIFHKKQKFCSYACTKEAKNLGLWGGGRKGGGKGTGIAAPEPEDVQLPITELPLCACGCEKRVTNPANKYILGHATRRSKEQASVFAQAPAWLTEKLEKPLTVRCAKCGWSQDAADSVTGIKAFAQHRAKCAALVTA